MGSQSSTRRDITRYNDEAINRSDVTCSATDMNDSSTMHSSSNNSTQRGKRWPRGQKKELAGRTFPSTSASTSSTVEAHQHNSAPRHIRKGLPRSPAKFVPKVEEDRDLMEALTVGLTHSTYDCMVCWDIIRPAHKIWNCQVCWAAFHLDCLSTWAKKSSEDSNNHGAGWRCPGCQNTQVSIPKDYTCFCSKVNEPIFNRYFTPHSCGELCGRTRDCPHPCNIPCHPGPCPPCGGIGPIQSCHCGNESFQLRCIETDFAFKSGKSCKQVCGELLGCGKHSCSSICHPGLCSPCDKKQPQKCYCGKHERMALCGEGVPKSTLIDGEQSIGYYECKNVCKRPLACGHHECTKSCHTLNDEPGLCPARPEAVKTCPCGAKPIESLLMGKERTSCIDHIPVCGGVCKKLLKCGHECMQKCHIGECSPCKTSVTVDCRCGSKHLQLICSEMGIYGDKQPTCQKPCLGLRSCGKHQCTKRCCPAKNQPKGTKLGADVYEAHMLHSKSYHVTVDVLSCIHPLLVVPQSPNANIHARGSVHVVMPPWQAILVTQILSHALLALCLLRSNSCGHRCRAPCHGQNPCPEGRPCQAFVISSCKCGNLTKDIVCGATSENPSDGKPRIIKCNDFCLIVERNKRVALALDIDDTTNRGPRIPHFDDYVLDYASANMEFTLKIEKRLEEWVVDSTLQTLNLSPMKGHHRKFVHELASHYNVTSESVDVEPYRSVVIHRKLNTSIPDLLASQACRQKRASSNSVGVSNGGIEQLRKSNIKDPINAIYLHDLVFGLTRTELSARLASIFGNIKYGIRWLTDDDAVLVPHPGNMSMDELEILLVRLRTSIKTLTTDGQLCERVELCWVNKEGEVTSHTSVRQSKHVFNATQGAQLKKAVPPKVRNTFSILDDDERVAAAKKAEEERILKAKEAAGTLSLDAWEKDEGEASFSSSGQKTSQPPSANGAYHSDDSLHMSFKSISSHRKIDQKSFFDAEQNVVDDWQELLDDDDDDY
ncbi:FKBP12-associated protein [Entomortierella lignicola]|nr:FKBP12-associated protein [Entomortierella lignicola]